MASQAQKMQLIKSDRHLFSASDDSAIMKQVESIHAPDGREVAVRPLLQIIKDIMQRATPTNLVVPQAHMDMVDNKIHHAGQTVEQTGMLEALAYTIHKLANEMCCKCSGSGDAHATTAALLHIVGSYAWDAKLVLALAAFAMSYGEFWLTAQLQTSNPLAKSVALLKQLPDILEHTDVLKPRFDALNNIMNVMLDVTMCIVELTELPTEYITPETPPMALAITHIPTAVYWTIRSIVACTSQIMGLIGMGHDYLSSTTETWELSSLAHKVTNIHEHLQKQLVQCHQHIEEKRHIEAFHLLERLFDSIHIDNMKILRALLAYKDETPLVNPLTKKRVSVEVLRRKIVVLFISDLDVSHDELMILTQIYNDPHLGKVDRQYEVVWLPVIDRSVEWTNAKEELFVRLANAMPWYSLYHPSLLDPAVIRYIKEKWNFVKKPLLVVLDTQGRVACPNALHMMWIWGSLAFPFTSLREETLWKDEAWRLEFLVDEMDPLLVQWIREGKFVCIYGGEDIEWIRKFTFALKRVSQEARIPIEMVYVGKSNPKERVRKIIATITDEKLSGSWHDLTMIWFFWTRLESMWYSKMQHGRTIENDPIVQEVMTMLTFDSSDQGWAVISKGSFEMVKAHGNKIIDCLVQFDTWKANIELDGFIPALTNALVPFHTVEHCTHLILPGNTGQIQEKVVCAECKRPMEKFLLYRCCTD
ncbi:protein SIEVE ELEMENT OCCLUSION B-like [Magnolia sinica]|uniref:protein SIEVE ELEMENT OCCLUSION B-like n=1 Tax=Magnolia sinica TaxID=86752 RepID=UPI0026590A37|nr:protein SIEVE ELEMENT OCCLUSION B-like [Magnolia sinica]